MNKKIALFSIMLLGVIALAACGGPVQDGKYAKLAQCLTAKGVKFYGAFWCPHCQEQKAIFGDDMRYINYVECDARDPSAKPEECDAKGVKSYPTWFFPGQGNESGVHEPADLAKKVGCDLVNGTQQSTLQTAGTGLTTAQPGLAQSGLTQTPGAAAPVIPTQPLN